MFTGIITAIGQITACRALDDGVRLTIRAPAAWLKGVAIGDSIAHNGVCLTVVSLGKATYQLDVSGETLACTTGLDTAGVRLNLEKALRLADTLGGHLVSGHVDGVGEVLACVPIGESHTLTIKAPKALARYIARKGSIAINGVSLTVNRVRGRRFTINLIPHTWTATTLHTLQTGSRVNLEIDLIARYAERLWSANYNRRKV